MYRVFLGAPSKAEIYNDANSYQWHTISSSDSCSKSARLGVEGTQSLIFPLATLEAASHRISLIYKNIIFDDASEMEDLSEQAHNEQDELEGLPAGEGPGMFALGLQAITPTSDLNLLKSKSRTDDFDNVASYSNK